MTTATFLPERTPATAPPPRGARAPRPGIRSRTARRRIALAAIVSTPAPVLANREITRAHHELGTMLAASLGPDAGPNFHTWAVWGSREAGRTIASRDVVGLTPAVGAASALLGAALGWWSGLPPVLVAVLLAIPAVGIVRAYLLRASDHISHGNRIVLEEIGGATIDFLAAVEDERGGDRHAVNRFLSTLSPGATEDGGQQLLRRAFGAYAAVLDERDPDRRHQLVFAANCLAVRHEHIRLQHDIQRSLPWLLRRPITAALLDFWVGDEHLHVGRDLAPHPSAGGSAFPAPLRELTVPEARAALAELRDPRRDACALAGSGATNWSVLDRRMDYIVDLFRSRHLAAAVWDAPYPDVTDRLLPD